MGQHQNGICELCIGERDLDKGFLEKGTSTKDFAGASSPGNHVTTGIHLQSSMCRLRLSSHRCPLMIIPISSRCKTTYYTGSTKRDFISVGCTWAPSSRVRLFLEYFLPFLLREV